MPRFLVTLGLLNVRTRPGPFCTYPTSSTNGHSTQRASRCASLILVHRLQEQAVRCLWVLELGLLWPESGGVSAAGENEAMSPEEQEIMRWIR